VASTLFTAGKKGKLAEILIQSNRLIGFIATLMLVPLLVYIKPLLQIWLELSDRDGTTCAVILLVSMYFLVVFRSSSVQILLMVNEQKRLTKIALAECVMNLVLSVILVGLDDCHYYGAADIDLATSDIPDGAFTIMLCHSPEFYKEAERAGFSLYLAGHTHGGQLCLPGGIAVAYCAAVPRKFIKGEWLYGRIKGYTSYGAGSSGVPARLFCPPEVALITLRKT
jgi:predicted MPP superfamily phosphohydrolase